MKRLLLLILAALPAFSAGMVTQTMTQLADGGPWLITLSWTADSADGSVPSTALLRSSGVLANTDGYYIMQVQTKPGATAPTANYDIVLNDSNSLDLMGGNCANRSASAAEACYPANMSSPIRGTVTMVLTGNSVNSAVGTVIVVIGKNPAPGVRAGAGTAASLVSQVGTYSTLPGTCPEGSLYFATDSMYDFLRCAAGNVWTHFLGGVPVSGVVPSSGWTEVNFGTVASVSHTSGGAYFTQTGDPAVPNAVRGLGVATPGSVYTITTEALHNYSRQDSSSAGGLGLFIRNIASDDLITFTIYQQNNVPPKFFIYTMTSSDGAGIVQLTFGTMSLYGKGILRLRIVQRGVSGSPGATRDFYVTQDNKTWIQVYTQAYNTFITEDQVGIMSQCNATGSPTCNAWFLGYSLTATAP